MSAFCSSSVSISFSVERSGVEWCGGYNRLPVVLAGFSTTWRYTVLES
eukprot:COSAG02_NODE_33721_length_495_cov_4.126263_1_plen_47_part_01